MTVPDTNSADYTLRPGELASVLALLVEARQPCIVWGPPGAAKSQIAQQVAAYASREYVDVRALLLDPVDLRASRGATAPTIAFIIDISSSLAIETLAEFWTELREVAAEIRPESAIVLQVDTVMQDAAEYAADDLPDEIAEKGWGGTDYRPGFAWLDAQGIEPGVCLYFTDI